MDSDATLEECCLRLGRIYVLPKDLTPKPPKKNFSRSRCFFAFAMDCEGEMSGDHIISGAVLSSFGSHVRLRTPHFEGHVPLDHSALKTKWVCSRHNSMFSPVDTVAGRFMDKIQAGWAALDSHDGSAQTTLFSGSDIERWFLKTLCATFFGGGGGEVNRRTSRLPPDLASLFSTAPWPRHVGVYFRVDDVGSAPTWFERSETVEPALLAHEGRVYGATIRIRSLELLLWLNTWRAPILDRYQYRPAWLHFGAKPIAGLNIGLSWIGPANGVVWLSNSAERPSS